jgi:hypothetical protein
MTIFLLTSSQMIGSAHSRRVLLVGSILDLTQRRPVRSANPKKKKGDEPSRKMRHKFGVTVHRIPILD